jgi:hypothetical protein
MARNSSVLRQSILAFGECASLVASSFGFSGSVEARMSIDDCGEMASKCKCWTIQASYDYALEQRNKATSLKDRNYWQGVMDATQSEWKNQGYVAWEAVVVQTVLQDATQCGIRARNLHGYTEPNSEAYDCQTHLHALQPMRPNTLGSSITTDKSALCMLKFFQRQDERALRPRLG